MTDPYRLAGGPQHSLAHPQHGTAPAVGGRGALCTALWAVLVVSAVGNTVASAAGAAVAVHLACGAVTAACVVALVAHHLRGRR